MKIEKEFHTVRGYHMLNAENKVLSSSMEDYMEMIYRICIEEGYIRVNQLAMKLNVKPSSTTKGLKRLKELGLVDYQKYGIIQLTDEGSKIGEFLLSRHLIIEEFLKNIGVEKTLLKDTEMIEHDVSLNTLKNINLLNEFFYKNPELLEEFNDFKEKIEHEASLNSTD